MFYRSLVMFLCLGLSASAFASEELIKERLSELVANPELAVIESSPIAGLYQVSIEGQVVYISADAKYLFSGDLIDLDTRQNLTDKAKERWIKVQIENIDKESMIIYPAKGETKHVVTVFTDIDCPFCSRLHAEVPELNKAGVEIRYLAYPRAGVGSVSYHKTVSVWCASDQNKMLDLAMLNKSVPIKVCNNPVASHVALAKKMQVRGTPNLILEDGQVLPGFIPAQELLNILNEK